MLQRVSSRRSVINAFAHLRHLWHVLGESIAVRPQVEGAPVPETIPPETPPLELSGRDYAISLLRLASEIEHSLMVQYLFAAYSLGPASSPRPIGRPCEAGRRRSWASPRRRWATWSPCRTCTRRSGCR